MRHVVMLAFEDAAGEHAAGVFYPGTNEAEIARLAKAGYLLPENDPGALAVRAEVERAETARRLLAEQG